MTDAQKAAHEALVAQVLEAAYSLPYPGTRERQTRAAVAAVYKALRVPTPEMAEAWATAHIPPYSEAASDEEANMAHATGNWQAMLAASPLNLGDK